MANRPGGVRRGERVVDYHQLTVRLPPETVRLLATAARIQGALVDAGLLPNPIPLAPIFAWPVSVDSTSCRG